ncbi:hypothetical protein CPB85DRAFT_1377570 [Mucidula mucida]|nr:hypothetical protein CPB85DRAFT_1377570 [Mucidula mucida]
MVNELVLERGQSQAAPRNKRVLVVAGGFVGFTTAWMLLDAGYQVTIYCHCPTVSNSLSADGSTVWEWPPAVCGKHTDVCSSSSIEESKNWGMTSYYTFDKLREWMPPIAYLRAFDHGARMGMVNFLFVEKLEMADVGRLDKWNQIHGMSPAIKGVIRDGMLINRHQVNKKAGVVDSYQQMSPMIDTDAYMRWLQFVTYKGAQLGAFYSNKKNYLLAEYRGGILVNATGLGARELVGDESVYPLRGALVRVVNDGEIFAKVTEALVVTHDNTEGEYIVFIVPRNILGGMHHLPMESPEFQRMRARCNNFPLVQGLRPFRGTNQNHTLVRSWRGFTLSFGCA